jgi:small subunit ribosomal protein S8
MGVITDPVADMLTRIRNANVSYHEAVDMPSSRVKASIAQILKSEGYIRDFEVVEQKPQNRLRLVLKYGPMRERVITNLKRVSRPGLRIYKKKDEIPKVMGGLGIVIISTPQGIMSGKRARREGFGGEVLAFVW